MEFKITDTSASTEGQGRLNQNFFMYIAQWVLILAIIIDYATSTNNISHSLGNWFYLFPVTAILPSIMPGTHNFRLFSSNYLVVTLYHLLVGLFLIFLTPIFGPYFLLFVLLLFISTYWHGFNGLALSFVIDAIIILNALWYQGFKLNDSAIFETILRLILLISIGSLFVHMTATDRNERKRLVKVSEEAHFERSRLLSLINSMADAVVAISKNGNILLYNGAALDLLNTNISLDNKQLADFLKLYDESEKVIDIIAEAHKSDTVIKREDLSFISNEGQEVDVYLSISPIRLSYADGGDEGFILVLRDITKEKSLDEQRDEFISVASHELRTPIAIMEGNISTAMLEKYSKSMDPEALKLLQQAHQNILFLSDLVNDLTTLARAERGVLDVELEEVDAVEVAQKLGKDYKRQAEEKGLALTVNVPAILPSIVSNYHRVQEILQNFVTNAIKYTEKGGVSITLEQSAERDGVIFSVKDTGIGIGPSDKKHVFAKFYRSEDFRTRKNNGTGLGLYISRQLAKKLGGKIEFESKLNQGSIFSLWLPQHAPAQKKTEKTT